MAGQIPPQFIDELLARVDIVDIIDARVALKKQARICMPAVLFIMKKLLRLQLVRKSSFIIALAVVHMAQQ
ncbi:hypothetical protein GCM10025856_14300 [Methylophaga marina]|nr:hypothetical protein GCM10025856_14300 [Methylophaga marina]